MQGRGTAARALARARDSVTRATGLRLTAVSGLALAGVLTVTVAASAGTARLALAQNNRPDPPDAVHYDTSPPLSSLAPAPDPNAREKKEKPVRHGWPSPIQSPVPDPVVQSSVGTEAIPSTSTNFDGVGAGFSGPQGTFTVNSAPPDPNGAVGPNNFVEIVNSDIAVFNKSGTPLYGPVPTNTLWSGFGGGCQTNNDGDGTVAYDRLADRWIITQFSVSSTPYLECVAVSTTGDPTGSYYRYAFQYSNFPDYPKLGVWPDAYYTTFNLFNASGTSFLGPEVCAYDRAKMLAGQAATQQCFTASNAYGGMLPSDLDSLQAPPAGSPNYVVALGTTSTSLAFWKFHVDWTTPSNSTLTGPSTITVASYSEACGGGTCIPQSGTSQQLDSLADRLMYRLAYRNFGDHESLVVDHSVTAGSSVGVRWYELRLSNGTPSVYQQGTYAPDSAYRWMGSIAMDGSGDIALGYSTSSSTTHPSIRYTGRLAGDALGTMTQGEATIVTGGGSQTGNNLSRWGDYTSMSVDPSDDCTFWYTNEYIPSNGSFNWRTRIGSFKFPSCGTTAADDFSIGASPSSLSVTAGSSGTSTISTAVTSGSAQTVSLSASGLPTGAGASFNPSSVTAGGSSTMTITTSSSTPAGTYSITVTGTGTSATHTTTVSLTVTAVVSNDFSISASPTSISVTQGSSGTSTISTAVTSGSAQSVSLSATSSPAGPTESFNPATVTAGGSSTMTVSVPTGTPTGTYTISVTGTGTSTTHTTTVTLTVTAATGGSGVTNGGFETGNLSGWSASGLVPPKVVTPASHTGAYSAQLGQSTAYNGNSTLTQTVSIPSGNSRLTFWYQPHCPDTLTYDQIQMQIRSTTGATLATVLNVCSNSGAWTQLTYDTSSFAGQTVVLWFNDHDDGYASDPTWSLLDDVAITPYTPTPNVVQNPGFETGSLASWSASGAFTPLVSTTAHAGSYAARVGSTSAVNGNSTLTQTVTVPAGAPALSFWYQPHCTDTLTYDQIQMQIRSTSGATLATVLNVCSNSGAWTQVNYSLSAYAGQTVVLWFNDHDDGYPYDPTYFLLDDVSVSG